MFSFASFSESSLSVGSISFWRSLYPATAELDKWQAINSKVDTIPRVTFAIGESPMSAQALSVNTIKADSIWEDVVV